MRRKHHSGAAIIMLFGLGLAACGDGPLTPPPNAEAPSGPTYRIATFGDLSYPALSVCRGVVVAEEGAPAAFRYQRFVIAFPKNTLAPDGWTQLVRVRAVTESGEDYGSMNCLIPATARAADYFEDALGIGKLFVRREEELDDISTASGLCDPYCSLPPIQVVVPPSYGGGWYNWCQQYGNCAPLSGSEWEEPCDPQWDPQCEQPLEPRDVDKLNESYRYLRMNYTDLDAKNDCMAMAQKFADMMEQGKVFRGRTDGPGPHTDDHYAAYDPDTGNIHFDPSHMDNANIDDPGDMRDILNSALHEAAHALGFDHTEAVAGMYAERPFNRLHPGSNSCIDYSN